MLHDHGGFICLLKVRCAVYVVRTKLLHVRFRVANWPIKYTPYFIVQLVRIFSRWLTIVKRLSRSSSKKHKNATIEVF